MLDFATAILPLLLSILVAVKAEEVNKTRAWKSLVLVFGLICSGVIYWQQKADSRESSEARDNLNHSIRDLKKQVEDQGGQIKVLKDQNDTEVNRRKIAEAQFQEALKKNSQETRRGVLSDIKASPIRVDVAGLEKSKTSVSGPLTATLEPLANSDQSGAPYEAKVTLQFTERISPLNLSLEFSEPIIDPGPGGSCRFPHSGTMQGSFGLASDKKRYELRIDALL